MAKNLRILYHVYLVMTFVGMMIGILYFLLMKRDFLTQYPEIKPYYQYYVGSNFLIAFGAILLLKEINRGFWIMILGLACSSLIEIWGDVGLEKILVGSVAILLLIFFTRQLQPASKKGTRS